jgi:hypothetical protein
MIANGSVAEQRLNHRQGGKQVAAQSINLRPDLGGQVRHVRELPWRIRCPSPKVIFLELFGRLDLSQEECPGKLRFQLAGFGPGHEGVEEDPFALGIRNGSLAIPLPAGDIVHDQQALAHEV